MNNNEGKKLGPYNYQDPVVSVHRHLYSSHLAKLDLLSQLSGLSESRIIRDALDMALPIIERKMRDQQ